MGAKVKFTCSNCGYSVFSSGGLDSGMLAVHQTHICLPFTLAFSTFCLPVMAGLN